MNADHLQWWSNLRHGGLLLDLQRLSDLVPEMPRALPEWKQDRLRREILSFEDDPEGKRTHFIAYVLEDVCGFSGGCGHWHRGGGVASAWTRRGLTGESLRPNHLWLRENGATLPVFIDTEKRIGIGRGKRVTSRVLQWLRQGEERLALITNGYQWRVVFAGLDYDAWSEWELEQWLAEGGLSEEFSGFRAFLSPERWAPRAKGEPCPLLTAINESRKGQADLSQVLGERVRQAAELLIDGHALALNPRHHDFDPQDIYRAAVRLIMRMVVILFAESREGLLPRDNPIYHGSYSLQGLRDLLERSGLSRLVATYSAWPRILALFRLIFLGSSHEAMPVPQYGGELFAPGCDSDADGMKRALHLFENACFGQDVMNDALVRQILELLTRTKIAIRQGRSSSWMMAPVDFSSLDSEYIGILYEGLLDFELRCAVDDQPIVFLAVGNQPALPLATLEAMDDRAVKNLFENLKDTSAGDEDESGEEGDEEDEPEDEEVAGGPWPVAGEEQEDVDGGRWTANGVEEVDSGQWTAGGEELEDTEGPSSPTNSHQSLTTDHQSPATDLRYTLRARAEQWARHAVEAAGLVSKPRGKLTPEKKMDYERTLNAKARQLVTKAVMPGEWYLVRWGGTRKGSGTFYTRPQLAIPTVARTLEPLCYEVGVGDWGLGVGEEGEDAHDRQESRRSGSVAEGDGPRNAHLSDHAEVSPRRDVRIDESTPSRSSIGPLEHRGGTRTEVNKGVSESSFDGQGFTYGDADATGNSETVRVSATGDLSGDEAIDGDRGASAARIDSRLAAQALTPNPQPPTSNLQPPIPNLQAPTSNPRPRIPRPPEAILSLKVCDPACGSGTFPLSALRYLTNALYESLLYHNRVQDHGGHTVLELIYDTEGRELLAGEALPCRPDDDDFEVRTKAVLRRYVVERCIYGVDLDPLAVELCRLSLWIETLDPRLPLTFLNHKIKCGNSLVGAWFDQFLHYPAMAWAREGGDKSHSNGVHFEKEAWTKAIKARFGEVRSELKDFLDGQVLYYPVDLSTVRTEHDEAVQALREIHEYGITQVEERAEKYAALVTNPDFVRLREAFDLWCALWFWPPGELDYAPMPLEFASDKLTDETRNLARRVAAQQRFFHWELEFPDVFSESPSTSSSPATGHRPPATGFDAILGNPPWDIAKPISKEFFSAVDPLYRSYGKQEAVRIQTGLFERETSVEDRWLQYNASFRAMSNWVKYAGRPFGDRVTADANGRPKHDLNLGERGRDSFETSAHRHARWKRKREETTGYADEDHAFRHQGSGDINLYKMFLEQAHALLNSGVAKLASHESGVAKLASHESGVAKLASPNSRASSATPDSPSPHPGGRLGLIVPSGIYSDHGTRALRRLFLDQCQWEWIFGFENREKVFDIDSRFKFNPVIVQKGVPRAEEVASGQCSVDGEDPSGHRPPATGHQSPATGPHPLKVAFMRRDLADWERAEDFAIEYPRERVVQFSPKSLAILEIQSQRDLDVLTKIYSNSVLLGDQGPDGWGIQYAREFDMTNDSKLFPPRPIWEEWGYRPDEYSRWIKGPWKPVAQLWEELGVASGGEVASGQCSVAGEDSDFQATGHRPPNTSSGHQPPATDHRRLRVAQPPYDRIPIPRADIPEGIILSREATHWLREDEIPTVTFTDANGKTLKIKVENEEGKKEEVEVRGPAIALPLYEGRMVNLFDFGEKAWISGRGRKAIWQEVGWENKQLLPQYLMAQTGYQNTLGERRVKLGFLAIGSATNKRSMYCSVLPNYPCGNSVGVLRPNPSKANVRELLSAMGSFVFDYVIRMRLTGLNLNYFVVEEAPLFRVGETSHVAYVTNALSICSPIFSEEWLRGHYSNTANSSWKAWWRITEAARTSGMCMLEAVNFAKAGFDCQDCLSILSDCAYQEVENRRVNPKGFWRVDKDKPPEHRHTVLTLVAFHDLQEKIAACSGAVEKGIEAFCTQNDGEGWMLPETLRLADYGLGHDDRAKEHQPVRECFGPRFYDWQLAQTPEESWRECRLHARNLLGKEGYQVLLDESLESGSLVRGAAGKGKMSGASSATPDRGAGKISGASSATPDASGQLHLDGRGFDEDIPLLAEEDDNAREEK